MKFKLDENLGESVRRRLAASGHDVSTIVDQQMAGATDSVVYRTFVGSNHSVGRPVPHDLLRRGCDPMFQDKNIDPITGGLLGRFIAEERDSTRRFAECYESGIVA